MSDHRAPPIGRSPTSPRSQPQPTVNTPQRLGSNTGRSVATDPTTPKAPQFVLDSSDLAKLRANLRDTPQSPTRGQASQETATRPPTAGAPPPWNVNLRSTQPPTPLPVSPPPRSLTEAPGGEPKSPVPQPQSRPDPVVMPPTPQGSAPSLHTLPPSPGVSSPSAKRGPPPPSKKPERDAQKAAAEAAARMGAAAAAENPRPASIQTPPVRTPAPVVAPPPRQAAPTETREHVEALRQDLARIEELEQQLKERILSQRTLLNYINKVQNILNSNPLALKDVKSCSQILTGLKSPNLPPELSELLEKMISALNCAAYDVKKKDNIVFVKQKLLEFHQVHQRTQAAKIGPITTELHGLYQGQKPLVEKMLAADKIIACRNEVALRSLYPSKPEAFLRNMQSLLTKLRTEEHDSFHWLVAFDLNPTLALAYLEAGFTSPYMAAELCYKYEFELNAPSSAELYNRSLAKLLFEPEWREFLNNIEYIQGNKRKLLFFIAFFEGLRQKNKDKPRYQPSIEEMRQTMQISGSSIAFLINNPDLQLEDLVDQVGGNWL